LSYEGSIQSDQLEPPALEEIAAYQSRMPCVVDAVLGDNATKVVENLPISPDMDIDDILDVLSQFLDMNESRSNMLGLFMRDEDSPNFPIPLNSRDFLGDFVLKDSNAVSFTLIWKRKFYYDQENFQPSGDKLFDRINYLQGLLLSIIKSSDKSTKRFMSTKLEIGLYKWKQML
jgi:hypothetical protein